MNVNQQQFFEDQDDPEVSGAVVLETTDDQIRLGEKWDRPNDDPLWCNYWMDLDEFVALVESGTFELIGELTRSQFAMVCQNCRMYGRAEQLTETLK